MIALLLALCLRAGATEELLPRPSVAVPRARQATEYSCGAAALWSVLAYWGAYDGTESGLYEELETTPKDGTEPASLARVAEKHGLKAALREGLTVADLRAAVARGETIILDIQAWKDAKSTVSWENDWEDGHYVVLAALDGDNAYVMDPSAPADYAYLPLAELDKRWHDYEDRHGKIRRYLHAGVVISGKKPAPRGLTRVE